MGDGRDKDQRGGTTGDNTSGGLSDELHKTRKKWRADYNETAPLVWEPPKNQGGWSSNTPGGDQSGPRDPNANGGQGKPPWRGSPQAGPTAPSDRQGGASNPDGGGGTGTDTYHPSPNQPEMKIPRQTAGEPGAKSKLGGQAASKQEMIENALHWHSGILGNAITAGATGAFVRGPGARLLSSSARSWLVNTELPAGPALFVHRNYGLEDGGKFFGQISRKETMLSGQIAEAAESLKDQVGIIEKTLIPRALSEEEQKALARYYELRGKDVPAGFKPGALLDSDKALAEEFATNDSKLKLLSPQVDLVKQAWEPAIKEQAQVLAEIDGRIESLAKRVEAGGGAAAADATLVQQHKFLSEFRLNPDAARPAGLKLEDIDELNTQKARTLNQQVTALRPGMEAAAEVEKLALRNTAIGQEFKRLAEEVRPQAEAAERKWGRAEAELATAEEKRVLQRYRFLSGGGMDELPKGVLTAEEEALVKARQGMQARLGLMPHDESLARSLRLKTEIQGQADKLTAGATDIEARLAANPSLVLTDAEKALKARHDFLKSGAEGATPKEAIGKFTPEEENLIAKRRIYGSPASIAEMENGRRAMKGEVEKIALKLKDEGLQLEHRATLPGNVFSAEEKSLLERFRFFKDGATGKVPDLSKLTAEEAALLGRREALEVRLAGVLEDSKLKASRGFKDGAKDFAKGWLIGEGVQMADDFLDRALHGKGALHNSGYFKSLVVPASILTPGGFWAKSAAGAGTAFLGHQLDKVLPASQNPEFSRFMRPNTIESIAVTGALMIPMKSEALALRAGTVAVAWFGSHLTNFIGGRSAEDIKNEAVSKWSDDIKHRTSGSLASAIDGMKDLAGAGREGDAQLHNYFAAWRGSGHKDALVGARGDIILSTAVGETTLQSGLFMGYHKGNTDSYAKAVFDGHNPKGQDYLLGGEDIDIGGRALKYLRFAEKAVSTAKTETQARMGQDSHGKTVTQAEIADLDKMQERIDKGKDKIYGKHDIGRVYGKLEEYIYKLGQPEVQPIYDKIQKDISTGSRDPRFLAKLYRDMALVDLAWAGGKVGHRGIGNSTSVVDGEGAVRNLLEAVEMLKKAQELDPSNLDVSEISKLIDEVGPIASRAQGKQWDSTITNPLQVDRYNR